MPRFTLKSASDMTILADAEADDFGKFVVQTLTENPKALRGASFRGKNMTGIALPPGADFTGCDFTKAVLSRITGTDVIFDRALFNDASSLRGASLKGRTSFRDAVISKTNLVDLTAENADFSGAFLADCRMTAMVANGADFSGTKFFGNRAREAVFVASKWGAATVIGNNFSDAAFWPNHDITEVEAAKLLANQDGVILGKNEYSDHSRVPPKGPFRHDARTTKFRKKVGRIIPVTVAGTVLDYASEKMDVPERVHNLFSHLALPASHGATPFLVGAGVAGALLSIQAVHVLADEQIERISTTIRDWFDRGARKIGRYGTSRMSLLSFVGKTRDIDKVLEASMTLPEAWTTTKTESGKKKWDVAIPFLKLAFGDFSAILCDQVDSARILSAIQRVITSNRRSVMLIGDARSPRDQTVPTVLTMFHGGEMIAKFEPESGPPIFARFDAAGRVKGYRSVPPPGTPAEDVSRSVPPEIVTAIGRRRDFVLRSFLDLNIKDDAPKMEPEAEADRYSLVGQITRRRASTAPSIS